MKNKITYLPIGILTLTTALAGVSLTSAGVAADSSGSKPASVTVGLACTFKGSTGYEESLSLYAGTRVESNPSRDPYTVTCNDPSGFAIKAVGFSPSEDDPAGAEGNVAMYNDESGATINTGTSGSNSYWSFKIGFSYATVGTATVTSGFGNYHIIPNAPITVVSYTGSTSTAVTGMFRPDYQVYASVGQPGGTYVGKVKYTIVPASAS